ncbi:G patch domain-containing protein 2-like [Chanos chanos]|uniref:G patch domain-containing protein 2-like n=1 Tax=Chanos chanos TaxID=29144 RepID=A0A6J2X128_CHACN|nr:G patch domain-containing protein 2-like [Chanos chanos]
MEELVQDLVSALEQTSEHAPLDQLWEEMILSPLQQRRQIRRRRGRKRHCDFSLHLPKHPHCLSEASESSLDETAGRNHSKSTAATCNYSDSDDMVITKGWPSAAVSFRSRQHSWPESDSFTENTAGRPLRRRRRVKRMTSDMTVRLQRKLRVSGMQRGGHSNNHEHYQHPHHHHHTHHYYHHHHHHHHQRPSKKQRLYRMKRRSAGCVREAEGLALASVGMKGWKNGTVTEEGWKDRILQQAKEHRVASDDNMSECETSSVCSSDPGLFTTDEGRQGDDEQSDWFFEGECGSGIGVKGFLPNRDPDTPPRPGGLDTGHVKHPSSTFVKPRRSSLRGCHTRMSRLPAVAARCIRKGRRRLSGKDNSVTVSVEKMRCLSPDPYQKELWLPSIGKRNRSQLNPPCSLPMYRTGMIPESSHQRCSSFSCKNRQTNVHMGPVCVGDIKRRRRSMAAPSVSAHLPFCREDTSKEACQGRVGTSSLRIENVVAGPLTSGHQSSMNHGSLLSKHREPEDD